MPKCVNLTKYFRSRSRNQFDLSQRYGGYTFKSHINHSLKSPLLRGDGGGRPDRSGRPPRLPPLPEVGFDGCGDPKLKDVINVFLVTHTHTDHLPVARGILLLCAGSLIDPIEAIYRRYGIHVEIQEYDDCLPLEHSFLKNLPSGQKKVDTVPVFGYFYHDVLVIPECDNYYRLLKDYRVQGLIIVFFKQPRNHPTVGPRINAWDVSDCYFADPSSWRRYAPNVLPKIVPSICDLRNEDRGPHFSILYNKF